IDLSSAAFQTTTCSMEEVLALFDRQPPSELLLGESLDGEVAEGIRARAHRAGAAISKVPDWTLSPAAALKTLCEQFGTSTLAGFGLEDDSPGVRAAGALIAYLKEQQRSALAHIRRIEAIHLGRFMALDAPTIA